MNKHLKIFIAILGGINMIFSVFIPTMLALTIIDLVALNNTNQIILIIVGLLSTLYRGIDNLVKVFKD